jgi:hypothetical protein
MVSIKNTDIAGLRDILRGHGAAAEAAVMARLSPASRQLFESALAFQWSPLERQMEIFEAAGELLFPGSEDRAFRLGRLLAERAYGGVYKAFLRIPSVRFVMGRAAQVWSSYYDGGEAVVENVGENGCELVVRGFPDFPATMREQLRGHVSILLERTGVKRYSVTHLDADREAWRWVITWE